MLATSDSVARAKRLLRAISTPIRRKYRARYGYVWPIEGRSLRFRIKTPSDQYVASEIFGKEDAYRLAELVPLMTGGVVVDIGAHKGFFAVFAGTVASRVLAFEPSPENFRFLGWNRKLNKMWHMVVCQQAVSDAVGDKTLLISAKTAARHTFFRTSLSGEGVKRITVKCTTLEQLMQDHAIDRISLLKIDCEGGEYDILMKTNERVFERISAIALEMHEGKGIPGKKADMISHLEAAGYKSTVYDERVMDDVNLSMALFKKKPRPNLEGRPSRTLAS